MPPPKRRASRHETRSGFSRGDIRRKLPPDVFIDRSIQIGDIDRARELIYKALDNPREHGNYRLYAKSCALPFYERALQEYQDKSLMEDCEEVYGFSADLLDAWIQRLPTAKSYTKRSQFVGEISELCIFTLGAREYIRSGGEFCIVPAALTEDRVAFESKLYGTDMRSIDLTTSQERRIQVKTSRNPDSTTYSGTVGVIAIEDLDPRRFNQQTHEESIYQRLIREVGGQGSSEDTAVLNAACQQLTDAIQRFPLATSFCQSKVDSTTFR